MRFFGAQFKEYRESYLNITQTEAAAALNMKKESLSIRNRQPKISSGRLSKSPNDLSNSR